ncbi:MAG: hypothetical protein WBA76_16795 [Phormidesmis sp.]
MNISQPTNSAFNSTSQASVTSRQQLEQLWLASPSLRLLQSQPKPSAPWYKQLGRFLMQSFTDGDQVRVWTKITPNGTQWKAYDPKLQRSFSAYSEAELRTWLEQRHYKV